MNKLAVVYFPKQEIEKINSFRKKYDPCIKIISPHSTVMSPLPKVSTSSLIEHVEKIVKNTSVFPIHFKGVSKTDDNCIFLLVDQGKEEVVQLHDKFYSDSFATYFPTEYSFIPHITIGDFGPESGILCSKALAEAEKENFDITDFFDTISIIEGDGIKPAKIIKTVALCS